jgi:lysozyme family protein
MNPADEFSAALAFTLKWEGGFVDSPSDAGGPTNFGITQKIYDGYRHRNQLPLQSVRQISMNEVDDIYMNDYWLTGDCDEMQSPLPIAHFDTCVNFGPFQAARFLQQSLGVQDDGQIGPITLKALANSDPKSVAISICDLRITFRYERVAKDPTQKVFLEGWLNRDNALKNLVTSIK